MGAKISCTVCQFREVLGVGSGALARYIDGIGGIE
jgi:hypothetical protein